MSKQVFRYTFNKDASMAEVEASLLLAVMACEGLHGQVDVLLDAAYYIDRERKSCEVDASTLIGRDFNRMLTGFLNREFAADEYGVELVEGDASEAVIG